MRKWLLHFAGRVKGRLMRSMTEQQQYKFQSLLNRIKVLRRPGMVARSNAALDELLVRLREIQTRLILPPSAAFLHFVYGFKDAEAFPYYAYLAIKSAMAHNPGWRPVFCCVHEPTGVWWEKIKPDLILIKMRQFDYFKNARLYHYAHKSDVVRLLMLRELGGVYLDIDTITVRSYKDLLAHEFGMAVQSAGVGGSAAGLCNAVMWGKRDVAFCRLWIDQYSYFNSRGRDDWWDFHSVKVPGLLAREHADKITILGHRAFFYPLWTDTERFLFSEKGESYLPHLTSAYGFHLWNGATENVLRSVTPEWVATSKSAYAHYARDALNLAGEPLVAPAAPKSGPARMEGARARP